MTDDRDADWRAKMSPDQFHITREEGTRLACTGKYWDHHEKGVYRCVCCDTKLFSSDAKVDAGSGWPSVFRPLAGESGAEEKDASHFMVPTEIHCQKCGCHLG